MQAIRQFYEDAPTTIAIPEALRHKRIEVILLVQDAPQGEAEESLKALLATMPDVGDDADFARQRDYGRGEVTWDS
jgi:hypothetical protein